jgi:hypothetical protein
MAETLKSETGQSPTLLERVQSTSDPEEDSLSLEGRFPKLFIRRWHASGHNSRLGLYADISVTQTDPMGILAKLGIAKPTTEVTLGEYIAPYESPGAVQYSHKLTFVDGEPDSISTVISRNPDVTEEGPRDGVWEPTDEVMEPQETLQRVESALTRLTWN